MSAASVPARAGARCRRALSLQDHPSGLAYLVAAEAFERFAFYGAQGVLVLYMTEALFRPGAPVAPALWGFRSTSDAHSSQALTSQLFGLFIGCVYLATVPGGYIGDRWLGPRRAVILGALAMLAGYLTLACQGPLLVGLGCIVVGCGALKGNITAQVGRLYPAEDGRLSRAYAIFYMGIALGGGLAPLVCGAVGAVFGWPAAFLVCIAGISLGLAIYLAGGSKLRGTAEPLRDAGATPAPARGPGGSFGLTLALMLVVCVYWIGSGQVSNVFTVWIRDHVDRRAFGLVVPTPWFQSVDSLCSVLLTPLLVRLWSRQASRGVELSPARKMAVGGAISALAFAMLGAACLRFTGLAPAGVPVLFLLTNIVGYLFVWPVGLALAASLAPPNLRASATGLYFTAIFFGDNIMGYVGGYYGRMSPASFWFMHAAVASTVVPLALALDGAMRRRAARVLAFQGAQVHRDD